MIFPESFNGLSGNSFCKQTLSLKTIDNGSFICYISSKVSRSCGIVVNRQPCSL